MSWNYVFSENNFAYLEPPVIQLWSVNNINPSSVTYSIVDNVTMMSGLQSSDSPYSQTLSSPMIVESGYILGLYIPVGNACPYALLYSTNSQVALSTPNSVSVSTLHHGVLKSFTAAPLINAVIINLIVT